MAKNRAPCGSWKSPITSDLTTSASVTPGEIQLFNGFLYWLERRPAEAGRTVIVRYSDNNKTDLLPPPFNARSRVHEYGGGVYCATESGVFFVNDTDQDIYRISENIKPERITVTENLRFADLYFDSHHKRLLCVCEDHRSSAREPSNSLVAIDVSSGTVTCLRCGDDFYSNPRTSPDGSKISWLCWNHPDMPWDGTELWVADLGNYGLPENPEHVAGSNTTSIFQPDWSPDNVLYFVSDSSGWWNLCRLGENSIAKITTLESEFGLPQWVFGQKTYAFSGIDTIFCTRITDGSGQLSRLDLNTLGLSDIALPHNSFTSISANEETVCLIAASGSRPTEVVALQTDSLQPETIARSCNITIDNDYISFGQCIRFNTRHGDKAYAFYYPPCNKDYEVPPGELPPAIVLSHSGPTGATDTSLDLRKQYWTSRGFAIIDVNYSGSTGYGRKYRERLKQNWGIRDVEDVCDAAKYFAADNIVDKNRLIIKGSSAGGYTVLAALTFHDVFSCGASYYGISDLESLVADTHKFESHYTDLLIGEYPEQKQIYHDRSPINFAARLSCPVIFFQGLEDRVVPPTQAETMINALKSKGVPVSYVFFEKEQHGFRSAATIKAALEAELYFYSAVFGFTPADNIPPIPVYNLAG
ncbi:MAG: prolyl oligopeptidase family serine peptidase [Gammaproteobacteria bacterium]|jgi:dienelactone hydrolase